MKKILCNVLLAYAALPLATQAEEVISPVVTPIAIATSGNPVQVVRGFYDLLTNTGDDSNLKDRTELILSPKWVTTPANPPGPGRNAFVTTVTQFHQAIPDLTWKVQQIFQSGNTYTVRGTGSGTPVVDFLGLGDAWIKGNSFKIMSIDIHTVNNGKIVKTYHLEEWTAATKQLTTPQKTIAK